MREATKVTPVAEFISSIIRLQIYPDSRDYVTFGMQYRDERGNWQPLTASSALACEYLTDVITVSVACAQWIPANCSELLHEGRHLYYRFRRVV